jgi:serine/threonine protein kinase
MIGGASAAMLWATMTARDESKNGRYRLVERIGQGGTGAVYRAIDLHTHRTVAVKQLTHQAARAAFHREAVLLAKLSHPALPTLGDFSGELLVMTYVPGTDLAHQLARRTEPFPLQTVLTWADQLLDLLHYLHTRSPAVLHHDIKPSNLKLDHHGQPVLLDMGLANQGSAGYTLPYAPLEQVRRQRTTPRSDLYALAATLYELLARRLPPDAPYRAATIARGQPDPLANLSTLNPAVPEPVAAVINRALALHSTGRPATARAMQAALRQACDQR